MEIVTRRRSPLIRDTSPNLMATWQHHMPRIFDNIDQQLLPALRETLAVSVLRVSAMGEKPLEAAW